MLMYVPTVYGFLPEINVVVFVNIYIYIYIYIYYIYHMHANFKRKKTTVLQKLSKYTY